MQHHYEGHWNGGALKIETFLGPEMARAKHENHYVPRHKNNKYINSYCILCDDMFEQRIVTTEEGKEEGKQRECL